jgi:hypothetical protein
MSGSTPQFVLIIAGCVTIASCYRPQFVDCGLRCGTGDSCPIGLTCYDGLCASAPNACPGDATVDARLGDANRDFVLDERGAVDVQCNTEVGSTHRDDAALDPLEQHDMAVDSLDRDDAAFDLPDRADLAVDSSDRDEGIDSADLVTDRPSLDADTSPEPLRPCPIGYYQNVVTKICAKASDLNGDGKADLVAVNNLEIDALISDGEGFTYVQWYDRMAFYGTDGAHFADVTGDGIADAVGFGLGYTGVLRSTGETFGDYQMWLVPTTLEGMNGTYLADVDGDPQQKADAVVVSATDVSVAISTGGSFQEPSVWLSTDLSNFDSFYLADADGDRRADLIAVGLGDVIVARSTGSTFATPEVWHSGTFSGARGTCFADVDGDGLADGVRVEDAAIWVALSDATRFQEDAVWFAQPFSGTTKTFVVDVTGDGRADVVALDSSTIRVARSTGHGFSEPEIWYTGQFRSDFNTTVAPDPTGAH